MAFLLVLTCSWELMKPQVAKLHVVGNRTSGFILCVCVLGRATTLLVLWPSCAHPHHKHNRRTIQKNKHFKQHYLRVLAEVSAGNFYLGPKGFIRGTEMGCPVCLSAKSDVTALQNTFCKLKHVCIGHCNLITGRLVLTGILQSLNPVLLPRKGSSSMKPGALSQKL